MWVLELAFVVVRKAVKIMVVCMLKKQLRGGDGEYGPRANAHYHVFSWGWAG